MKRRSFLAVLARRSALLAFACSACAKSSPVERVDIAAASGAPDAAPRAAPTSNETEELVVIARERLPAGARLLSTSASGKLVLVRRRIGDGPPADFVVGAPLVEQKLVNAHHMLEQAELAPSKPMSAFLLIDLSVAPRDLAAALTALGANVNTVAGDVASVRVPYDRIAAVGEAAFVKKIEVAAPVRPR